MIAISIYIDQQDTTTISSYTLHYLASHYIYNANNISACVRNNIHLWCWPAVSSFFYHIQRGKALSAE